MRGQDCWGGSLLSRCWPQIYVFINIALVLQRYHFPISIGPKILMDFTDDIIFVFYWTGIMKYYYYCFMDMKLTIAFLFWIQIRVTFIMSVSFAFSLFPQTSVSFSLLHVVALAVLLFHPVLWDFKEHPSVLPASTLRQAPGDNCLIRLSSFLQTSKLLLFCKSTLTVAL